MTPLKWFQRCHRHRWNHGDGKVKNFLGTSTTEFFLLNFSSVNDTAVTISAVSLPLLKQIQGCQWHRWNRFWRLSQRLSRWIRCHMQNGFILLIRDIYGGDWCKKTEGRKSRATVPLNQVWIWTS
jgi:hypothetical protein